MAAKLLQPPLEEEESLDETFLTERPAPPVNFCQVIAFALCNQEQGMRAGLRDLVSTNIAHLFVKRRWQLVRGHPFDACRLEAEALSHKHCQNHAATL